VGEALDDMALSPRPSPKEKETKGLLCWCCALRVGRCEEEKKRKEKKMKRPEIGEIFITRENGRGILLDGQ
jgi:hypothetical protein